MNPLEEGRQAFFDDIPLEDNPYNEDEDDHNDWEEGWMITMQEQEIRDD